MSAIGILGRKKIQKIPQFKAYIQSEFVKRNRTRAGGTEHYTENINKIAQMEL